MKRLDRNLLTALDVIGQSTSKLQDLIEQGANVNASADKKYEDSDARKYHDKLPRVLAGYTPLMILATHDGGYEAKNMAFLIENGADMDIENDAGFTPLMLAAANGNYDCVEVLLKAGAKRKDDALVEACNHFNIQTNNVRSLLTYDRQLTIEKLLSYGADINAFSSYDGDTPLTMAINSHEENVLSTRLLDIVKYLVDHGADPLLPKKHGSDSPVKLIKALPVPSGQTQKRDELANYLQSCGENMRLHRNILDCGSQVSAINF